MNGLPRFTGFVRTFVLICAGVFVLETLAGSQAEGQDFLKNLVRFCGITPELFFKGMIYQVLTWVFFHGDMMHLLFNMLGFWMFGSLLQDLFGERRFVKFCLLASVLSGLIVAVSGLIVPSMFSIPTIGASGLIFAILMAVSRLFPNQVVLFMFIFPMKMRYFAYLLVGLEFYALWRSNAYGISNVAHLGGAAVGWFCVDFFSRSGSAGSASGGHWWKNFKDRWRQRQMRKKLRVIRGNDAIKRWN